MDKKKEIIITIVGIVILLLAMATATYAMFTFTGTGVKTHTITSGLITFSYTEGTNNLSINSAYPIADEDAETTSNYFQFTVGATSDAPIDIDYQIFFMPDGNNTLDEQYVKLYLTTFDSNVETEVFAPALANSFATFYNEYGYLMLTDTYSFTNSITSLNTVYRLRMWIDSSYTGLTPNGEIDTAKVYKIKVNVVGTN